MMDPPPAPGAVWRAFGIRLVAAGEDGAELAMPARAEHAQEAGVLQGGVLAVLADQAAVHPLIPAMGGERMVTSIEFKLNFLRPAHHGAEELVARSRIVHRGRKIALSEVEVLQAGRAVARGSFTYLFYRVEPAARDASEPDT